MFAACPGILRRLAGLCYETLLLSAVLAVTLILPHLLLGAFAHRLASPPVLWAHLFFVLLVYSVWFWSHGGQTLAMKTWRIRLVSKNGHRNLAPGAALLRKRLLSLLLLHCICIVDCGEVGHVGGEVVRVRRLRV